MVKSMSMASVLLILLVSCISYPSLKASRDNTTHYVQVSFSIHPRAVFSRFPHSSPILSSHPVQLVRVCCISERAFICSCCAVVVDPVLNLRGCMHLHVPQVCSRGQRRYLSQAELEAADSIPASDEIQEYCSSLCCRHRHRRDNKCRVCLREDVS